MAETLSGSHSTSHSDRPGYHHPARHRGCMHAYGVPLAMSCEKETAPPAAFVRVSLRMGGLTAQFTTLRWVSTYGWRLIVPKSHLVHQIVCSICADEFGPWGKGCSLCKGVATAPWCGAATTTATCKSMDETRQDMILSACCRVGPGIVSPLPPPAWSIKGTLSTQGVTQQQRLGCNQY
jgi:hypothetical protein